MWLQAIMLCRWLNAHHSLRGHYAVLGKVVYMLLQDIIHCRWQSNHHMLIGHYAILGKVFYMLLPDIHCRWQSNHHMLIGHYAILGKVFYITLQVIIHCWQSNIIIMYIYHALINTLSAHMIHVNLNMIFYTHVKHSLTKTIYIKYYLKNKIKIIIKAHYKRAHTQTHARVRARTHTYTYTDCSRNWEIFVRSEILWEEEGFQFGFKRWQGWAVSKVLWEVNSKCGVQSKRKCGSHESCVCIVGFPACECQKKSVVYEMECRHAAVQRGKQDQNHL